MLPRRQKSAEAERIGGWVQEALEAIRAGVPLEAVCAESGQAVAPESMLVQGFVGWRVAHLIYAHTYI